MYPSRRAAQRPGHGVPERLNQVGARLRWEEDGRILCQGGEPVSGYNKSILDKVVHVATIRSTCT